MDVSKSNKTMIDTTDTTHATDMADLMDLQLDSHDEINCKIVELEMIFVTHIRYNPNGVRMEGLSPYQ